MRGIKITDEEKQKIYEMYANGYSQASIAERMGTGREAIYRTLKHAREQGIIQERGAVCGEHRKRFTISSKNDVALIKGYRDGLSYAEIAEITGMTTGGVGKRVRKLILDGRLDKRTEKRVYKPREKREKSFKFNLNEKPINCTIKVCATCVYGYERPNALHKCRFSLCTGKCRSLLTDPPMSARKCLVYEKITKTNPRRKDIEDELFGNSIN